MTSGPEGVGAARCGERRVRDDATRGAVATCGGVVRRGVVHSESLVQNSARKAFVLRSASSRMMLRTERCQNVPVLSSHIGLGGLARARWVPCPEVASWHAVEGPAAQPGCGVYRNKATSNTCYTRHNVTHTAPDGGHSTFEIRDYAVDPFTAATPQGSPPAKARARAGSSAVPARVPPCDCWTTL